MIPTTFCCYVTSRFPKNKLGSSQARQFKQYFGVCHDVSGVSKLGDCQNPCKKDEYSRKLCKFTDTLMSGHNNVLIHKVTFGFKRYKIFTEDFQTTDYWDSGALTLQFSRKVSWKYFSLSYKPQVQLTNLTTCWLDHVLPHLKPSSSIFAHPIFFALKGP